MSYERQEWKQVPEYSEDEATHVGAEHMIHIEGGIIANEQAIAEVKDSLTELDTRVTRLEGTRTTIKVYEDSDFTWTVGYYASHLQGLVANSVAKTSSPLFLKGGETIRLTTRVYNDSMAVMFKSTSDGTPLTLIFAGDDGTFKEYVYTADSDCYIRFTVWVSYGFNCEVTKIISGNTFTVAKNGGDFSSFTDALRFLADIEGEKVLYVESGTYDIYEELGGDSFINTITDPSSTNWRDVNVLVPKDTHVIGRGMVKLVFNPTDTQIKSQAMAFLFSPLNVSDNCEIENIQIECSNCRYGIHDESSGLNQYANNHHIYRNVSVNKTLGTYGMPMAFGAGLGSRCRWLFESCEFKNNTGGSIWSTHTSTSDINDGANIIFNNCIFDGIESTEAMQWYEMVRFLNGADINHKAIRNIVKMNNCYIKGRVSVVNEASSPVKQTFDVTAVGCHAQSFKTTGDFSENPYPFKEYMNI